MPSLLGTFSNVELFFVFLWKFLVWSFRDNFRSLFRVGFCREDLRSCWLWKWFSLIELVSSVIFIVSLILLDFRLLLEKALDFPPTAAYNGFTKVDPLCSRSHCHFDIYSYRFSNIEKKKWGLNCHLYWLNLIELKNFMDICRKRDI